MVRLDLGRWAAVKRNAFNHIGIERPLCQKFGAANRMGSFIEDVDEQAADDFPFLLGLRRTVERIEKTRASLDMDQGDVVGAAKQALDFLGLAFPQKPVIDKDACQAIADGFMQQNGSDSGIDPAGKPANDLGAADGFPDSCDCGFPEGCHGPGSATARYFMQKISKNERAARRVYHFRMELYPVKAALLIGDRRIGRVLCSCYCFKARGQ